jgi:hypothetical protein
MKSSRRKLESISACLLALLFVLQSVAGASSLCFLKARLAGSDACCCSAAPQVSTQSCCSTADREESGEVARSAANACDCSIEMPPPLPAVPREATARGALSDKDLDHLIGRGLCASIPLALPWCAPFRAEVCDGTPGGMHPFPEGVAGDGSHRGRGFLTLICIARC